MVAPNGKRDARRLLHLQTAVREAGVKLTPQRLQIFRELVGAEDHPDAETLHRAVRARMPSVSLDTVYRTLWMLCEVGLVKTLGPSRDVLRFDVNLERHHHYVCVQCGLVRDFDSKDLDGVRIPTAVRSFGSVLEAQVEVRGLCASCQGKSGKKKSKAKT
jgi:Fur family peroxide stress response transcriptional regulator